MQKPAPSAPQSTTQSRILMLRHLDTIALIIAYGLGTSACFDPSPSQPNDTEGTGTTDSDGGTTAPTTDSSTTDDDRSNTTGDGSTGSTDRPPEIVDFTVNGSASPAEVTASGMVVLDVDAIDDLGIDRVEFYDSDELVGTSTESPYRLELLLTSADSGPHVYTALAVDTSSQEALSEPVSININVVGGQLLETRENIGIVRWSSAYRPSIGVTPLGVHITSAIDVEDKLLHATVGHWTFSDSLSLIDHFDLPLSGTQTSHMVSTTPITPVDPTGFLSGGMTIDNETWRESLFSVAPDTQEIIVVDLGPATGTTTSMLVVDENDNLVYTRNQTLLVKSPNFGGPPTWSTDIGNSKGAVAHTLATGLSGDIFVGYTEEACVALSEHCLRKFAADGSTIWTRGLQNYPQAMAISDGGHVAMVTNNPLQVTMFDANGDIMAMWPLADVERRVQQIEFDTAGGVIAIGYESDGAGLDSNTPWAGRFNLKGTTIWEGSYDTLGTNGLFTGLATTAGGQLYVVGFAENFDATILDVAGQGFVAELAL